MTRRILVVGAGGFIGGHLVRRLLEEGSDVTSIDVRSRADWWQDHVDATTFDRLDASRADELDVVALATPGGFDEVYNLAAHVGGIGYIQANRAECTLSSLVTSQVLLATRRHDWGRLFFASSACVYPAYRQREASVTALRESDAYPADPEDGYGWEKLFGEHMHLSFAADYGVEVRVARYHNTYGPLGSWSDGREKAPAALCRKVAQATLSGDHRVEVWGDGEQARSFTYVDDTVEGTLRLTRSDVREVVNVGSSELVTINGLLDAVEAIAGTQLERVYLPDAPQGVRGRNSDNALIQRYLGWEPTTPLATGVAATYPWVFDQVQLLATAQLDDEVTES